MAHHCESDRGRLKIAVLMFALYIRHHTGNGQQDYYHGDRERGINDATNDDNASDTLFCFDLPTYTRRFLYIMGSGFLSFSFVNIEKRHTWVYCNLFCFVLNAGKVAMGSGKMDGIAH